jgi:hypothetical protein
MLVLHRAPEPFNEDVVQPSSFAVHADRNAVGLKEAGELLTGELAKSPAMISTTCWRNWMIWLGCGSNCSASSATVLSPSFRTARATLARNSGENVRRDRLIEMLLGAQRLNDQRPIINYRPISKKRPIAKIRRENKKTNNKHD